MLGTFYRNNKKQSHSASLHFISARLRHLGVSVLGGSLEEPHAQVVLVIVPKCKRVAQGRSLIRTRLGCAMIYIDF